MSLVWRKLFGKPTDFGNKVWRTSGSGSPTQDTTPPTPPENTATLTATATGTGSESISIDFIFNFMDLQTRSGVSISGTVRDSPAVVHDYRGNFYQIPKGYHKVNGARASASSNGVVYNTTDLAGNPVHPYVDYNLAQDPVNPVRVWYSYPDYQDATTYTQGFVVNSRGYHWARKTTGVSSGKEISATESANWSVLGRYQREIGLKLENAGTNYWQNNQDMSANASLVGVTITTAAALGDLKMFKITNDTVEQSAAASSNLEVTTSGSVIFVNTGLVSFEVKKDGFNVIENVIYDGSVTAIPAGSPGLIYEDHISQTFTVSNRTDIDVEIEEAGTFYCVIKATARTIYTSQNDLVPGLAVRIYAWADKPFIKVDVQIQNSDKSVTYSSPFYFDQYIWRIGNANGGGSQTIQIDGPTLSGTASAARSIDLDNMQCAVRYSGEMWPTGYDYDGTNLDVELWPKWGKMFTSTTFADVSYYWLQDMQHAYKEVFLNFGPDISNINRVVDYPPVAVVPLSWYKSTAVTLDLGGTILSERSRSQSTKLLPEEANLYDDPETYLRYIHGWNNFRIDKYRKLVPANTGNWPYSGEAFICTGQPGDLYEWEQHAMGELNIHPQWLAGFTVEDDYSRIEITNAPYGGWSWRKYNAADPDNHNDESYTAGTTPLSRPRDDAHGWWYHVGHVYWHNASPWIKDWFRFMQEYRRIGASGTDPYPSKQTRARAHLLGSALQAYQVLGDADLWSSIQYYTKDFLHDLQDGINDISPSKLEAGVWIGYVNRQVANVCIEANDFSSSAFTFLEEFFQFNYDYIKFGYNVDLDPPSFVGSGNSSQGLADPLAWYLLNFTNNEWSAQLKQYVTVGIPTASGDTIYEAGKSWTGAGRDPGNWNGRLIEQWLYENSLSYSGA